jgi:Protein of unknown function (DUF1549)/Protein of unknown function (DUF1553)
MIEWLRLAVSVGSVHWVGKIADTLAAGMVFNSQDGRLTRGLRESTLASGWGGTASAGVYPHGFVVMSRIARFTLVALAGAVVFSFVGLRIAEVAAAKPAMGKPSAAKFPAAKAAKGKTGKVKAAKSNVAKGKAAAIRAVAIKPADAKITKAKVAAVETSTAASKQTNSPIGTHAPADSLQTAARVDQSLAAELSGGASIAPDGGGSAAALPTAQRADDETFLRRVSLDLAGDSPSPEEITAFALDPSADKRAKAVERLLADTRFGENWARYWRDVIMYRRTDDRAQIVGPTLEAYLAEQFNRNAPWSEIASSFITATGDIREKGETALIMAQMGQAPEIAAETARIFMGVQVQCAQCHDHPTDRWKRKQFHELAAFFPRVDVRPVRNADKRTFQVVSRDFQLPRRAANPNRPNRDIEHYMPDLKDPGSKGTLMQPVLFVTGQKLDTGASDTQRREALAEWLTAKKDPWFAKAFVNRIWAEMVGEGFYEPVDDMGPDRTCSAPKTLDILAMAFASRNYDVKWLYRTIAATEAYQRESRSRREPGEGAPFVANCPQPLRADQLYDALVSALGIKEPDFLRQRGGANPLALQRGPRGEFNRTFGFDPSQRRDEVASSIPQALVMMNSPIVNRAINARNAQSMLGQILAETKDDEAVATELYLRCLAREPKPEELKTCLAHLREAGNRGAAFEDILWALVNSTEFLHRR